LVPERRHVMRVPSEPGGDWRRFVVVGHRTAVLPFAEMGLVLRDARFEVELEEGDAEKKMRERRAAIRRQGHRERAALEEQVVPLEREEIARRDDVAHIEESRERERDARQNPEESE